MPRSLSAIMVWPAFCLRRGENVGFGQAQPHSRFRVDQLFDDVREAAPQIGGSAAYSDVVNYRVRDRLEQLLILCAGP
ncbi:hypothetical protein GCM10020255_023100 [Rhodococcus baikonurensis]